jgi:maltose alpha-D-glucosyltransferase/alpha-amylase
MTSRFAESAARATAATASWRQLAETAFLTSYEEAARGSPVWLDDEGARQRLLRLHLLAKALYEIDYEANNRPDWIETPVRGVLSILEQEA